ncbi:MAG: YfcE family phosphodiesterase [Oscillospiraceae bacterium]|nr:YfcE family phosphodiesterase [Oscillospiraceae bacterium]
MQILVFSDSHNTIASMEKAVREISPDLILHLGDYETDAKVLAKAFPHIPLRFVRGNCDLISKTPETEDFIIAEKRIVMTHGHRYKVKSDLTALCNMGHFAEADLLLFGHTHIPYYEQISKMHVLNPGSAAQCAGLIEITDGEIRCKHIPL